MSIISREKKPKGGGQSPQFKMRIDPALKEQLDAVAAEEGKSRQLVKGTGERGFAG
jgi:predicted HicB family RNase H-like nuclease